MNLGKNKIFVLIATALLASALFLMPINAFARQSAGRYIVVFKKTSNNQSKAIEKAGGKVLGSVKSINAKVAVLTRAEKRVLSKNKSVLLIEKDQLHKAVAQNLPWGVQRVNAPQAWATSKGTGVKVAVLDTGIALKHKDLKVAEGFDTITYRNFDDKNGHGTHVAGIIAALDNNIGVVGVAPEASLMAVKVLNNGGSGYTSDIIEGIDWAVSRNARVINMSLGGGGYSQLFQDAIRRANSAGVVVVAASGNSAANGNPVTYPAAYDKVIAVGATDSSNAIGYFSSYGPYVDLSAPGVSIYSTYKGGAYATLSGTSMASPHVAGVAALRSKVNPGESADALEAALKSTATDLGAPGWDPYFGYGLVNAQAAVAAP